MGLLFTISAGWTALACDFVSFNMATVVGGEGGNYVLNHTNGIEAGVLGNESVVWFRFEIEGALAADLDNDNFFAWQAISGVNDGGGTYIDGDTNGDSFLDWQAAFGSGSGSVAVPEPASLALGGIMLILLGVRIRTNKN